MQEIGDLARQEGWDCYMAYSGGRDGVPESRFHLLPVGNRWSVVQHGVMTRLFDRHGLASAAATREFVHQIEHIRPDIIHIHNIHGYFLHYGVLFDWQRRGFPWCGLSTTAGCTRGTVTIIRMWDASGGKPGAVTVRSSAVFRPVIFVTGRRRTSGTRLRPSHRCCPTG